MKKITIIDCKIGNRTAIRNMLKLIGENPSITNSLDEIKGADIIILPGIGSYDSFMRSLVKFNLQDIIKEHVLINNKPILGICIGMQALFNHSEEGNQKGLGLIDGAVEHIKKSFLCKDSAKVPHIGWKSLNYTRQNDIQQQEKFYFAHSYHCVPKDDNVIDSFFRYEDEKFVSSIRKDNIWGVQFHPEKSHIYGINFFQKFLAYA
jgi:glutamine amidotransferase